MPMTHLVRRLALVALLAATLALAGPAHAITYGSPDGNRHPNVGALVGKFESGNYPYCSGALISPTVYLTAAHCDIGTSAVFVTFDSVFSASSKLHSGTFYPHPGYNQVQADPHDIAVVVFDKPIKGIARRRCRAPTSSIRWSRASPSPQLAMAARRRSISRAAR